MESTIEHTPQVAGQVHVTEQDGIFTIQLGTEEERVITLTHERVDSLRKALELLKEKNPKGVIISGPRANMFAAGADINAISEVEDPIIGEELGRQGQAVFQLIEDLSCTTVAAISGPCMGGGCELSLACRYRLISDDPSSQIGLPETKLGILPGWGGTQRLPRLIGIREALGIILPGKSLRPKQAKRSGVVHEVVPAEKLLERAHEVASRKSLPGEIVLTVLDRFLTFTAIGRFFVRRDAESTIKKQTKGKYPAPPAALNAVMLGLSKGTQVGYPHEAAELGRLLVTPESRALVNLFFLTEGAKRIGKGGREELKGLHSYVLGAGTMGAGIASVLAQKRFPVILKDTKQQALDRAQDQIQGSLEKKRYLSSKERSEVLERIESIIDDSDSVKNANFVIEAIIENLDIKKKVLGDLSKKIAPEAIICTNTSSLSVSEIAAGIEDPSRVVGMHFFNPVEKMPLVEIIRGKETSDKTIMVVAALTSKLGKNPIVVEDVPGFLVNRILSPYLNEAGRLLEEGYHIPDIDKAAIQFGMPMGPIRLLDEVGLDVAAHVASIMEAGYGDRMKNSGLCEKLVEKDLLGKKNGNGFYTYDGNDQSVNLEALKILDIKKDREIGDHRIVTKRLMMSLINEAVCCLDEGVAGAPGKEAANQIDLGTVMGIGFPPFRGGLIAYAESLGAKEVLATMKHLEKENGERFAPHSGIVIRGEQGKSFYEAVQKH